MKPTMHARRRTDHGYQPSPKRTTFNVPAPRMKKHCLTIAPHRSYQRLILHSFFSFPFARLGRDTTVVFSGVQYSAAASQIPLKGKGDCLRLLTALRAARCTASADDISFASVCFFHFCSL